MRKIPSIQFLSRLRTRLILLVLLAVIPALGLTFYIASISRRDAATDATQEALRVTQLASADEEQLIERTHQLLITLTQFPEVHSNNSHTCDIFLDRIRLQYPLYTVIGLIDSSGYASCNSPLIQRHPYLGDRPYFKQVLRTHSFAIGKYQIGRITSRPSINLAYPILSENGLVQAVIYAGLDLSWLNQLARSARLPTGASLTFIDRDGTILADNLNPPMWVKKSAVDTSLYKTIVAHKGEGTAELSDVDGKERLYAFTRLQSTPDGSEVYVSVGIPSTVAFANSNRILAYSLAELGLVLILTIAAIWHVCDALVLQQLHVLLNVTERLNAGDLKARTGVTQGLGEMAQLAISFDTMAASLENFFLERQQIEQQLLHNAERDPLTQLPNRAFLIKRLRQLLKSPERNTDCLFAVLFIDLDRFKLVNDSLGHFVGDQLLIAIARRLETCLHPNDLIARLGGDEFTILLENINDMYDATQVANRIHQALVIPFIVSGHELFTSASIGITLSNQKYDQPEDLLRDADTAMYKAKALGKARYQLFTPSLHLDAVSLLQLETDLQRAIKYQQFRLYYQPIVLLENLRLIGFEVLLRWQHPQQGMILPTEFIGVAEETGLIVPIGQWVLSEACHQLHRWQKQFSINQLSISINISGKQFLQSDLVNQVKQVIQETGLNADNLKLEITESVMMENAGLAIDLLSQLKSLGVQLHVDDFGTGFSSLSYLHCFPLDALKIDRSFISRMGSGERNTEIISTIITLAHKLKIEAIAEGIETAEQLAQLQKLNCTYGQGYLFAKPLHNDAVVALIKSELARRYDLG